VAPRAAEPIAPAARRGRELAHKTIVLCSKELVNYGYRLCHEGVFDDYVLV